MVGRTLGLSVAILLSLPLPSSTPRTLGMSQPVRWWAFLPQHCSEVPAPKREECRKYATFAVVDYDGARRSQKKELVDWWRSKAEYWHGVLKEEFPKQFK